MHDSKIGSMKKRIFEEFLKIPFYIRSFSYRFIKTPFLSQPKAD
ncbi:hypothetical protein LEP1GSC016_2433 [Leptospira borgpetersenii serovar Hardjo-bovis str. Sponselee]|uniref:Uncharacterized protein n=1 Tax=Leptospira borgpetersenii serovar Hardjo-bovis str. Sponselee TaxID=1303729 RepID=M6BEE4_LEPBO|nr:hypothetical protein LEP1GSC016_2433 [Leptospira borgpetersenii serovar Hardjo-bovis str. Sponselee]